MASTRSATSGKSTFCNLKSNDVWHFLPISDMKKQLELTKIFCLFLPLWWFIFALYRLQNHM